MTNQPDRLDRVEALAASNTEAIAQVTARLDQLTLKVDNLTENVNTLTYKVDDFIETSNRVIARSAVLDDVVLELRESSERNQRNFEEHQRTTNAALNSLEAILLRLITNFP